MSDKYAAAIECLALRQGAYLAAHKEIKANEIEAAIRILESAGKSSDSVFIAHIQSHLGPGQEVICKICGKTAREILLEPLSDEAPDAK